MMLPILAFCAAAAACMALPAAVPLAASQEMVGFVSLLMAGLLPAMILTATVLRGDRFSASRVRDYGDALRRQLGFWALLFMAALVSVFFITAAKILSGTSFAPLAIGGHALSIPREAACRALLAVAFGALAVVLTRLWPAYKGLRSVLDLTVQMAELHALANDRSLKDGLDAKTERVRVGAPEHKPW